MVYQKRGNHRIRRGRNINSPPFTADQPQPSLYRRNDEYLLCDRLSVQAVCRPFSLKNPILAQSLEFPFGQASTEDSDRHQTYRDRVGFESTVQRTFNNMQGQR